MRAVVLHAGCGMVLRALWELWDGREGVRGAWVAVWYTRRFT